MKEFFKSRITFVLLFAAAVCFAFGFLFIGGQKTSAAAVTPNVAFKTVTWPNMDESGGVYGGTSVKGMLLTFDKNLSNDAGIAGGSKQKENLAEQIGNNFLLNSIPMNEIEGAQICYFNSTHLWISAPGIETKTFLEIREGTQVFDAVLPEIHLCNHVQMFRGWHQEQAVADVTYADELWWKSNYGEPSVAGGAKGALLAFSGNLSSASNGMKEYNFAKESIGNHVKLGGVPISQIEGAYVIYHSGANLFVYAPNMFAYRTLTIDAGTVFLGARFAEGMNLYLSPEAYQWVQGTPSASERVDFSAISWNSVDSSGDDSCGGGKGVLLTFSKNLSVYGKENGTVGFIKSINLAGLPIADGITFNGKPLSQIAGANIRYFNGPHLWIQIPEGEKGVDDLNGCAYNGVLSVKADTPFLDVLLPSLTIYREGDVWGTEQNVLVQYQNEDGSAYGDPQKIKVGTVLQEPAAPTKTATNTQTFKFDGWYNGDVKWDFNTKVASPLVLKAKFTAEERKYTVTFQNEDGSPFGTEQKVSYEGAITAPESDPTKDATAEFTYKFDGWYNGETKWDFAANKVTQDLVLKAKFSATKNSYKVTIAFEGIEGKQPVELTLEYGAKVDFSKYAEEHHSFEIFNGKEKITEFTVMGNADLKIVYGVEKFTVTFDGKDSIEAEYGSKVQKPASDPKKDATAEFTYRFDGWYNGDKKWNFETDTVTGALNLTAKFTAMKNSYTVTIVFEGIEGKQPVELTLEYGAKVDFSKYAEEGYTCKIFSGDKEVTELTVSGNTQLKIVYEKEAKGGCSGFIVGGSALLGGGLLAVAAVVLKKRRQK